jgi:hypothetical protein
MARMRLSDDEITEFTAMWKQEFKESLPSETARHIATRLLELYCLLAAASESEQPPA